MEIDKTLSMTERARQFLKALPKEGVILHMTPAKNKEIALSRGFKGRHGTVWFFAFQTSSRYCLPDYSSKTMIDTLGRLRKTLNNVMLETSRHTISGSYLGIQEEDYPAVVVAKRLLKNDQAASQVYSGDAGELGREVAKEIPAERMLFVATISPEEYQAIKDKAENTPLPARIKKYLNPRQAYFHSELSRLLSRKVISGLLEIDSFEPEKEKIQNDQRPNFKRFLDKIVGGKSRR